MKNEINWNQYQQLIKDLALKVKTSYPAVIPYDQILCLARGGLIIGDAFNRIFKIPLAVLFTSSYKINQSRGELFIDNQIAKQTNKLGKKILVVDDLVDSGHTLTGVIQNIKNNYQPEIIHTAVIWKKKSSMFHPEFYVKETSDEEWIIQPFETFDDFKF